MRNVTVSILLLFASIAFSSCYKKLYEAAKHNATNLETRNNVLIVENNTVKSENDNLKKDNTEYKRQNDVLKDENVKLKEEIQQHANKTKKFDLFTRLFCCDNTTEAGADEVYITILGTKIGSGDVFVRAPGNNAHWDMNDGNQPTDNPTGDSHCITNRTLFSGELKPGEVYFFNVAVCEEDGGTTRDYQNLAAQAAMQSGDPYAIAAGQLVKVLTSLGLFAVDKDDWMGMFGLRVKNDDGNIIVEWKTKEGIVHIINDATAPNNPNMKELRMNHDGSNYVGWFGVRY